MARLWDVVECKVCCKVAGDVCNVDMFEDECMRVVGCVYFQVCIKSGGSPK